VFIDDKGKNGFLHILCGELGLPEDNVVKCADDYNIETWSEPFASLANSCSFEYNGAGGNKLG